MNEGDEAEIGTAALKISNHNHEFQNSYDPE